ncbi:Hypp4417 [Branchiostoma lanceolatum]|uniref:Hypp4417 protein n=1 Tax=Branchiostoma lanceolatum TaxID=7740 RepID=A0A8K0A823_BRALA|nr:Hypp4417 [Branchiostoma lanceolatum]
MGYKPAMFLGLSALLMVLMVDQADSLRQKRFVPQQALAALDLLANDTVEKGTAKILRQGSKDERHHEDDGHDHTFLRGEESEEHHEGDGHDHKFLRGEESEEHYEGDGHDHKFLRGEESEEHHEGDGHDHKFLRQEEEEHHEGDGHDHKILRGEEEEEHHEGDGHDHRDLDRMVPQEARTLLDLLKVLADGTATGESDKFLWDGDEEEEEYLFEFLGLGQDEESHNETNQEHGNNKTYEVGGKNHDEHNGPGHNSDEPVLVVLPSLTEDERPSQSYTSEHNVSESNSHDEQNEGVGNGFDEKFSDLLGQFVTLGQRFSDLSQKFLVLGQNFLKDEGLQDGGHDDSEHYEGDGHDHTESNR